MKLTPQQRKVLEAAARDPHGFAPVRFTNNGLGSASRRRMQQRLCVAGYLKPYVHGGYEITAEGRAAVTQQVKP